MKRLLVGALLASAAVISVPTANAVCAHSHGNPHVHSGSCGMVCQDDACAADIPLVDDAICVIAEAFRNTVIQC